MRKSYFFYVLETAVFLMTGWAMPSDLKPVKKTERNITDDTFLYAVACWSLDMIDLARFIMGISTDTTTHMLASNVKGIAAIMYRDVRDLATGTLSLPFQSDQSTVNKQRQMEIVSRYEVDMVYAVELAESYESLEALFADEMMNGKDPAIREYAAKKLSGLIQQRTLAESTYYRSPTNEAA